MSVENSAIQFSNVSFSYEGKVALDDISFTINEGDYVGIIGPNGAGKTTLIKLLLTLLKPTTGAISVFNTPIDRFAKKYKIGYVPQRISQLSYYFPATVEEVVMSGLTPRLGIFKGIGQSERKAIADAMDITGVTPFKSSLIGNLSGGQRQRVFIARALVAHPKILVLDEPTVGVDVSSQEMFYGFLSMLNKKHNITILFVTHDIDVITKEAQYVLCINKELVCHVQTSKFNKKEYLQSVYGKKVISVHHEH